ncbi:MAG: glutathione S-transferase N-terminal domain-containing protein [Rhodospirillales bacterium]
MIKFYTAATPHGQRAAFILEECGLDYKVACLDLMKGEQRDPAFLKLNPRGQIPVVVDDEGPGGQRLVITQSAAILLHYAKTHGVLWPEDKGQQALALQWTMHAASDISALAGTLFAMRSFVPDQSDANLDFFLDRLEGHLRYIEGRLGEVAYLAGDISIADLALYPMLVWEREALEDLGDWPCIAAWMERLEARPAIQRGMVAHERD